MKQPQAPRQTLVWTSDMDPRQQKAIPTSPTPTPQTRVVSQPKAKIPVPVKVTPPVKVAPAVRVVAPVKAVANLPTAELPPTRIKTPKEKPAPKVNPAKAQRRQEILQFAADHQIGEAYARHGFIRRMDLGTRPTTPTIARETQASRSDPSRKRSSLGNAPAAVDRRENRPASVHPARTLNRPSFQSRTLRMALG